MLLINNLADRIGGVRAEVDEAINRVLSSGWLVLGPSVKQFEEEFATYLNVRHCISVANGTDAIELALKSLDLRPGDLVATVANAGMYASIAIVSIGAQPIYMDVDINTKNVTLDEVSRAIDEGAKAVVITHLYGLAVSQITKIAELCKIRNVKLLEDCAQAHGARVAGLRVGTFGDVASFSFYPTKNLGALGDGGAVVTNDTNIAERVVRLRQYGWSSKYKVELSGARNSRLDEVQAAILSVFLPSLDATNARRRFIATQYSERICHEDVKVPVVCGDEYVAHLYAIRVTQRDALRVNLEACGIATDIHYPIPDHRQPVFGGRYLDTRLQNTEILAAEILTLPLYPEMTDEQVEQVVLAVNRWDVT